MKIYNVYQSGKRLYIDEKENPDNKIVVNKYDNMQQTLRLISDGTLPPRLYWALRNPKLSNKYFILKLVNNQDLIVGTDISATPGLWDMLLIGTDEDYIIEGIDIDQSRLTYVSDHFGRLFVRDNFLEELDFEEQCSPTFKVFYDEIIFQLGNKADKKDIPDKMSDLENDTNFISGVALKDDGEGNVSIVGTTFSGGETEEEEIPSGVNIEVDDKLDEESTNPVQNKIITKEVKSLKEKDKSLDDEVKALKKRNAELESSIEKLQIKSTTDPSPFHHITDSANYRVLDFGMEGITEQETVPGNQLFDISKVADYMAGNNTLTNNGDGSLTVKLFTAISVGGTRLSKVAPNLVVGETYTLNAITTGTAKYAYLSGANVAWTFGKPLTITEAMLSSGLYFYANGKKDEEVTCTISDIMINPGSTPLPYEPYVGGIPSPNPEHEEEITLAGVYNEETGRYEHKCRVGNKNILNLKREYDVSGSYRGWKFKDDTTKFITISVIDKQNGVDVSGINFGLTGSGKDGSGGVAWLVSNGAISLQKYTHNALNYFTIFPAKDDVLQKIKSRFDIQIEYDMTATDLLPHASQPLTLTSDRPLTKWDNLVKVDGKWYWDYKQRHWTINDTADWYAYDSYKGFFAQCCFPVLLTNNEGYCNQLRNDTVGISPSKVSNHFWIGNNRDHFYVLGSSYYDESLEDKGLANWKAHLNENPLEIYTYKDESELVPLLDEEQELLNNLETYYGVTNVYNEQGCPMWLCYTCDSKLYVDQKLEQINNALLSLGANV